MNKIGLLFFSLIRVAIGSQEQLPCMPTAREWEELYHMAQKQALLGICFAGVQKIINRPPMQGDERGTLPEVLYLRWMAMAAKIQHRNEVVNRQCVELQERFSADGIRSSILKGQGAASFYEEELQGLRQSGDIDIWVDTNLEEALRYAKSKGILGEFSMKDIQLNVFHDTEVEMHVKPSILRNPFANRRWQEWAAAHKDQCMRNTIVLATGEKLTMPSIEFNLVYMMVHKFHHIMTEGIGLRQLIDYYMIMNTEEAQKLLHQSSTNEIVRILKRIGLERFAAGIMYIMERNLGMPHDRLLCEPDSRIGTLLLAEMMHGGNFGQYDERFGRKYQENGRIGYLLYIIRHNWHLFSYFPMETFSEPLWMILHYLWKRVIMRKWL